MVYSLIKHERLLTLESRNTWVLSLALLVVIAFLAGCVGGTPEVQERIVEVPVERVVEKKVTVEIPVDRVVEREVTVEVPVVKSLVVNNLQQCVDEYDPEADYFPDKTEAEYAL